MQREKEAECTQAEGEAGSMQGARITPWAEGGAKLLSYPGIPPKEFKKRFDTI